MRWDWIPLSASALVVGAMALAFAVVLNPVSPDGDAVETVRTGVGHIPSRDVAGEVPGGDQTFRNGGWVGGAADL